MEKDLDITSPDGLRAAVADVKVHGDPNFWICISKASSQAKGWMHSTKVALLEGSGLLVQTSTEIRAPGGGLTSSQALTYIPNAYLECIASTSGSTYAIKNCDAGKNIAPGFCFAYTDAGR